MKKYFLAILAALCVSISHGQTAATTITPTEFVTTVTDSAGDVFTVTTPYTTQVILGPSNLTAVFAIPPPVANAAPAIPNTATSVSLITQGTWKPCEHDAGTPGTGTCANNYPVTGIFSDSARGFSMAYTNAGGVRWANSFANDTTSTNFVLDAMVESPDWTHVADLELDTNQVKANGTTTILGTECASQSKTWEYTLATNGAWHWVVSSIPCNPLTWTPGVQHHIRIFGTISAAGISTYLGVEFDGVYSAFSGATGSTADALGWGKGTVLDNVQIDGFGSAGSATVYMDRLTVFRW